MDHMLQRLICLQIVLYDLKKPGGFNVNYTSVSVIYLALLQIRFWGLCHHWWKKKTFSRGNKFEVKKFWDKFQKVSDFNDWIKYRMLMIYLIFSTFKD